MMNAPKLRSANQGHYPTAPCFAERSFGIFPACSTRACGLLPEGPCSDLCGYWGKVGQFKPGFRARMGVPR